MCKDLNHWCLLVTHFWHSVFSILHVGFYRVNPHGYKFEYKTLTWLCSYVHWRTSAMEKICCSPAMSCCNSQSMLRFSQCHWCSADMIVAGLCWTDTETDMSVKKTTVVCEYHRAPTTQLYTWWDYVMNTDMMLLSSPTFLGHPQLILCRDDDYISQS